jgi:hypothetical protein
MSDAPTDPADTASDLAADLRALRLRAESPTLAKLQHDSGVSRSVLSSAFAGRQLPSARTIDRTVRALGEDSAPWIARRDAIARRTGESEEAVEIEDAADDEEVAVAYAAARPDRRISRGRAALLAGIAFVAGFAVAIGASWAVGASIVQQVRAAAAAAAQDAAEKALADSGSPQAQINVHTGVDPAMTPCVNDAEVATSDMRTNNTKLEIIWSNKCYAGWARVTRYDEKVSGNSVTATLYPETAPFGPDRQSDTVPNVQGVYTNLIVRPTPQTLLCAVGVITVDGGETIDLGEPLCI